METDAALAAVMRRLLVDPDDYPGMYVDLSGNGLCLDGWIDLKPDELPAIKALLDEHRQREDVESEAQWAERNRTPVADPDGRKAVAGFYGADQNLIDVAYELPFTVPEGTAVTVVLQVQPPGYQVIAASPGQTWEVSYAKSATTAQQAMTDPTVVQ